MDSLLPLQEIGEREYGYLIESSVITLNKLRFSLTDKSFLEIFMSIENPGRWAFHWERRHLDGKIFRHDNIPHKIWNSISSFPWHFHNGSESQVIESNFGSNPIENLREIFALIKQKLYRE